MKSQKAEITTMLDETLGIWQDSIGYYWIDQFERVKSRYFKSERAAIRDCKDLIWVSSEKCAK